MKPKPFSFRPQRRSGLAAAVSGVLALALLSIVTGAQAVINVRTQPSGDVASTTYVLLNETRTYFGHAVDATSDSYRCTWTVDGVAGIPNIPGDPYFITTTASFANTGLHTLTLTCEDFLNPLENDSSTIEVLVLGADTDLRMKNSAIDRGLRYSYQQQNRGSGCFAGSYSPAPTGMALVAMENHGHNLDADDEDIYRWSVEKGLQCIYDSSYTRTLSNQACIGDPESDDGDDESDGFGIEFGNSYEYVPPFAALAIVNATTVVNAANIKPTTTSGSNLINGVNSLIDIIRDWRDYTAWSMTDINSCLRNGWRYSENYSSIDNSVTQWPVLALLEAYKRWGIDSKQAVKDQLEGWLDYSQSPGGSYGYSSPGSWLNTAKAGAGIIMRNFTGHALADAPNQLSLDFIGNDWNNSGVNDDYGNKGAFYAMYAVFKGMKLYGETVIEVPPGSGNFINWEQDYNNWLVANQNTSGYWSPDDYWMDRQMTAYVGVAMLAPEVSGLPPVAVPGGPFPNVNPMQGFQLDGSNSFHQDPARDIIVYQWDFNAADGLWWTTKPVPGAQEGATGQMPMNPGYPATGADTTYTITLRVLDDGDPQLSDTGTATVMVTSGNVPPVAVTNGPWASVPARHAVCQTNNPNVVNLPNCFAITFDASSSHDPNAGPPLNDSIALYEWDIDGDGVFNETNGDDGWPQGATGAPDEWKIVKRLFRNPVSGLATLRVTDRFGLQGEASDEFVSIALVFARKYGYCYSRALNRFTRQKGVRVTFGNVGDGLAENVVMTLTDTPANVTPVKSVANLGDLAGGDDKSSACGGFQGNSEIVWNINLRAQPTGGWKWKGEFDFDGVHYVIPNLPAVWTVQ